MERWRRVVQSLEVIRVFITESWSAVEISSISSEWRGSEFKRRNTRRRGLGNFMCGMELHGGADLKSENI